MFGMLFANGTAFKAINRMLLKEVVDLFFKIRKICFGIASFFNKTPQDSKLAKSEAGKRQIF